MRTKHEVFVRVGGPGGSQKCGSISFEDDKSADLALFFEWGSVYFGRVVNSTRR